jgi:hypothetical protein
LQARDVEDGVEELEVEVAGDTEDGVDADLVDAFPHVAAEGDFAVCHVSHALLLFICVV